MAKMIDPGGGTDFFGTGPVFGVGGRDVKPPGVFKIDFTSDKTQLIFTIGDAPSSRQIRNKSTYRVYFASIDLAPPSQIGDPFVAERVFEQAGLVFSVSAPLNGGNITQNDSTRAGSDGWFFATAMNFYGVESRPTSPIRNPLVGTNDQRVAPNVLEPTATLHDAGLDPAGRQLVEVTVTAKIPFQSKGVQSVTLVNPAGSGLGSGHDYTKDFFVTFIPKEGDLGHGAVGLAHIRDGSVFSVEIINPGEGYVLVPTVSFDQGDGEGAAGVAVLTPTGSISGVQIYLNNYFSSDQMVEGPMIAKGVPHVGQTIRGKFLLVADSPPAHFTSLYFVSISQAGTRRTDINASPAVDFANGIHL